MAADAIAGAPRKPEVFAFVFPMASGHFNPSLPVARSLVRQGHEVHYVCAEQMRSAVEDTGARFHSHRDVEPELFDGREADMLGAMDSLKRELGLDTDNILEVFAKLLPIQLELRLPGLVRCLRELHIGTVAYCPMLSPEGAYAAEVCGLPSVAVFTAAGPGSQPPCLAEMLVPYRTTLDQVHEAVQAYAPRADAIERLRENFGVTFESTLDKPFGRLGVLRRSHVTLVTTSEELQDPMTEELAAAYARDGVRFAAVGPLLDEAGAARAAGHRQSLAPVEVGSQAEEEAVVSRARAAKAAGRPLVLVSMGTVITGDSEFGWNGRPAGPDGKPRGLTGRELCQGAWAGVFDAFGRSCPDEGPLIVVALGPQPSPLGDQIPPPNAVCVPTIPQVDLLKAGVDVFLTHGGQNSLMEALSSAVPIVVCPGFGDQVVNARKAEALGVGLQIPRPDPDDGEQAAAVAGFRRDVTRAVERVFSEACFRAAVARCSEGLRSTSGVPGAVAWMLAAASQSPGALGGKAFAEQGAARSPLLSHAGA